MNRRMDIVKPLGAICAALALFSGANATAQTAFKLTFKGIAYQRDGSGNVVGVPITEQTLIADRAGGVNPANLVMAYILDGNERGDTIEFINTSTGSNHGFMFGLWFGDDRTTVLGRTALTNSALTEIHRVDQVFTLINATYSSENSHGVGTACVTKRFVRDTSGVLHATIEGPIQWMVNPWGTNQWAKICHGTFVATQPLN
jgi:hypothetical protein